MIGRSLGRYRIVELLGSGGMGSVYRAADDHLGGRLVALKVLREDRANPHARDRIRKEALTLARLQHPNIASVYDCDAHDGIDFIVTEHVAGRTLEQVLAEGPLPLDRLRRMVTQIAAGLDEAHSHGIVHCDLKPSNVMVAPDDGIKILDFGIARHLLSSPDDATLSRTLTGAIAGTPTYMAPEQIRGGTIDPRTDVYALGLLAYEMATGRKAGDDESVGERGAAAGRKGDGLDPALAAAIKHATAFQASERLPTAGDFARAVAGKTSASPGRSAAWRSAQRPLLVLAGTSLAIILGIGVWVQREGPPGGAGGCGVPAARVLAVLPLRNLSGDPNEEYFADGMTEALISDLAQIGRVQVISRTSAMTYKGTNKRLPEIARELGVQDIVEGSVQRSQGRIRVIVQMVRADPEPERSLWSNSYVEDAGDVLALQGGIAQDIARSVSLHLTDQEKHRLEQRPKVDPQAYDAYLRGRMLLMRQTEEENREAVRMFEKATRIEPTFAPAWSGIAEAYYYMSNIYIPAHEAIAKARAAVDRALAIDPDLGEAHAVKAIIHARYDWDYVAAQREIDRARRLQPSSAVAAFFQMNIHADQGRFGEATRDGEQALRLDPLSTFLRVGINQLPYSERRYDVAERAHRQFMRGDPDYPWVYSNQSICLSKLGRHEEAIRAARRGAALGDSYHQLAYLGVVAAAAGQRVLAESVIVELHHRTADQFVSPVAFAMIHANLGDADAAFESLDRALELRDENLVGVKTDPMFDPIRRDPRFARLIQRMNVRTS